MARQRSGNPLDNNGLTGRSSQGNPYTSNPFEGGSRNPLGGNPGNPFDGGNAGSQNQSNPLATRNRGGQPAVPEYRQEYTRLEHQEVAVDRGGVGTYVVRGIREEDLSMYGFLWKLMNGVPLTCNYRHTITLINEESAAHQGRGQGIQGTVYGRIEGANLEVGDRVQVMGKQGRRGYKIHSIFDVTSQQNLYINRLYKNPMAKGNQGKSPILLIILFLLIALGGIAWIISNLAGYQMPQQTKTTLVVIVIAALFVVWLFASRFQLLRTRTGAIIGLIVLAVLFAKFFPEGESIIVAIITLIAIVYIIKSILK